MQNKNARSYKMHPANLRAVGADKVMQHKFMLLIKYIVL